MTSPDALLVLGTHCPHCPAVLYALSKMIKTGEIGRLEVVNLEQRPEIAQKLGVRSVPWLRLGLFELPGLHSLEELQDWAKKASSTQGMADYLSRLLNEGQLKRVIELAKEDDSVMDAVFHILGNPDAKINVRLGIGVVMEEFQGSESLHNRVGELGVLSCHDSASIRADACHYLALTGSEDARPYLQGRLKDNDKKVREIAQDGLEVLAGAG